MSNEILNTNNIYVVPADNLQKYPYKEFKTNKNNVCTMPTSMRKKSNHIVSHNYYFLKDPIIMQDQVNMHC